MRRGPWLLAPLVLLAACAPQPEREAPVELPVDAGAPPRERGTWELQGATLVLADGTLVLETPGARQTLAHDVVGPPAVSADGDRVAYARQVGQAALSSIAVIDGRGVDGSWSEPRTLVGHADRPALSPDGGQVAFVSGSSGIASVWLVPFEGGEPVQLTNRDLRSPAVSPDALDGPVHPPGQPPAGFVPPPHTGPPRFEGDRLVWDAPDGAHGVDLP